MIPCSTTGHFLFVAQFAFFFCVLDIRCSQRYVTGRITYVYVYRTDFFGNLNRIVVQRRNANATGYYKPVHGIPDAVGRLVHGSGYPIEQPAQVIRIQRSVWPDGTPVG